MAAIILTNLANYNFGLPADEVGLNVEKVSVKASGAKKEVMNRIGQIIGRADYQKKQEYSISGYLTGTFPTEIGGIQAVANTIALGGVSGGLVLLDDASVERSNEDFAKISYTAARYPDIPSTATQTHVDLT